MNKNFLKINWPNKNSTFASVGDDWFLHARKANFEIPTGCLNGSCGACEIDVDGETVRPCVTKISFSNKDYINVDLTNDPFW